MGNYLMWLLNPLRICIIFKDKTATWFPRMRKVKSNSTEKHVYYYTTHLL